MRHHHHRIRTGLFFSARVYPEDENVLVSAIVFIPSKRFRFNFGLAGYILPLLILNEKVDSGTEQ